MCSSKNAYFYSQGTPSFTLFSVFNNKINFKL